MSPIVTSIWLCHCVSSIKNKFPFGLARQTCNLSFLSLLCWCLVASILEENNVFIFSQFVYVPPTKPLRDRRSIGEEIQVLELGPSARIAPFVMHSGLLSPCVWDDRNCLEKSSEKQASLMLCPNQIEFVVTNRLECLGRARKPQICSWSSLSFYLAY